jgi:hypothetical protein
MALTMDTTCLYSVVQNTSGGIKRFGFLPPHGKELAADEQYSVFGNILEAVNRIHRGTSQRHRAALEIAIDAGDIVILEMPNPILLDTTTGLSRMIELTGGALTVVENCWTNSLSA